MNKSQTIPSDGLNLAVETIGQGPPIVWAHGLTGTHRSGIRQFSYLADRFQIIVFDQRGHWRSTPVTDPALYDAERMATDIGAVMDAFGIEQAFVGGESMGATTALLFALANPERVQALMLSTPAFGDAPHPERNNIKGQGDLIARKGIEHYLRVSAAQQLDLGWPEQAIDYLADVRRLHDPFSLVTALQTVPDWVLFPDLSALANFDLPTMVTARQNDPIHPASLAERMAGAFPDAHLVYTGSIPDFLLYPERSGRLFEAFLTSGL
jgi:pimeloyl-ACP methyl ester carboxylesterase